MMAEKLSIVVAPNAESASASAPIKKLMQSIFTQAPAINDKTTCAQKAARVGSSFTQKEIRELFKVARRVIREPELTILLAPVKPQPGRLLLIIPRSVGNAVTRNHLRRQIKAIFHEQNLQEYGSDCIVIARPGAAQLSFDTIQELILEAFSYLGGREPE